MIYEEKGPIDEGEQKSREDTLRIKKSSRTFSNMKKVLQGPRPNEDGSVEPTKNRRTEEVVNKLLGAKPPQKTAGVQLAKHIQLDADDTADTQPHTSDIPQFDLAEQIMAEQRKISSLKRTRKSAVKVIQESPRKIVQESPKLEMIQAKKALLPTLMQQHKILTEIVARDIRLLTETRLPSL